MNLPMNKPVLTSIACLFMFCIAMAPALPAQTFTLVHGFDFTDGQSPWGLVQGTDGNLYGVTEHGGAYGYGSIFKSTTLGRLTTLHSFCSGACLDGAYPVGAPIQATDGNFYGVTNGGGAGGRGTAFKLTPNGVLTTLYTFCSSGYPVCPDGIGPFAGLVEAANGSFYGTTQLGGANNYGTVFKLTPSGKLTTLHSFDSTDGSGPLAALVQASDGNLYGTTQQDGVNGVGTIFKITLGGKLTTIYNFCSLSACTDGEYPDAGLIQAADGDLYGTTGGRPGVGYGNVFKITLGGTLTTLHDFCSFTNCADGAYPDSPLVQANDGNFYGATSGLYTGSVFEITPAGALTTLYTVCLQSGCLDGDHPDALILDTNGKLYGTTVSGGIPGSCSGFGCGVLFSVTNNLQPFVETVLNSGKVGAAVTILGTNLTGATAVKFNQTPASFTVLSSSQIRATVPVGATTGTLQVVTPSGTLASIEAFTVTQ
jgi:uncharacterized repeat protein (TIGR03803 family)